MFIRFLLFYIRIHTYKLMVVIHLYIVNLITTCRVYHRVYLLYPNKILINTNNNILCFFKILNKEY